MKKFALIGLIFLLATLANGCATVKPKMYVPESELPKTKFVVIETIIYEKFEVKDEEFVFSNQTEKEYGTIFKEALKKELEEKGFVVLSVIPNKKDGNDFLLVKVSLADKPPIVPILTNGIVVLTAIVEKNGKILWRMDGGNFTDPPIVPASWVVRVKMAPALAKSLAESFKKF